jgi:hypothetical protein
MSLLGTLASDCVILKSAQRDGHAATKEHLHVLVKRNIMVINPYFAYNNSHYGEDDPSYAPSNGAPT